MSDREKAIVMAYTGIAMLTGEKIDEFYKYLAELYGRPVYTHEIVTLDIQEKAKPDFVELCRTELPSAQPDGRWEIIHPGETGYSAGDFRCSVCGQPNRCYHLTKYCCNCGARMVNRGKVKKEKR